MLAALGAEGAAEKLMGMEPQARASIIESMAPRDAANTLVSMEDALQVGPAEMSLCALCEASMAHVLRCAVK